MVSFAILNSCDKPNFSKILYKSPVYIHLYIRIFYANLMYSKYVFWNKIKDSNLNMNDKSKHFLNVNINASMKIMKSKSMKSKFIELNHAYSY